MDSPHYTQVKSFNPQATAAEFISEGLTLAAEKVVDWGADLVAGWVVAKGAGWAVGCMREKKEFVRCITEQESQYRQTY